jgi:hypothetical protein
MWRNWVASARADAVVVFPVPGVPVINMFGFFLMSLSPCAMLTAFLTNKTINLDNYTKLNL